VDFIQRTRLFDERPLRGLAQAGAFDAFGLSRRRALWDLAGALKIAQRPQPGLPLFDEATADEQAELPPMTPAEQTLGTFGATGYTVDTHLAELCRADLIAAGCQPLEEVRRLRLRPGQPVRIGGLVMDGPRRPPTANGLTFVRLEESQGIADVTVPEEVYDRDWEALRRARVLIVEGVLQRTWPTVSVLARAVSSLRPSAARLSLEQHVPPGRYG
jgi:error-prone DNA polymerase